jgi:hypothetical protein
MDVKNVPIYSLLPEQSSLSALFGSQVLWRHSLLVFLFYLIIAAFLALLFTRAFSNRFKTPRVALFAFFFCLNFFVPVLGTIGSLVIVIYFVKFSQNESRTEFFNVPLPPFQMESASMPVGMGEGGAWSRLRTITLPREQRLKALLAIGSGSGGNISRFLQLATGDKDDEIRLLAFNLCGRQEQTIQKTISTALAQLKNAMTPANKAACCRTLAFAYWEMIYNSLAQDKLHDFFVDQSVKYAHMALQSAKNTPDLAILMIRIYIKKQDYVQAEAAINEALALGADGFRVMPYQAELAFKQRDFATIKRIFGENKMMKFRPGIGPVAQFWVSR